MRFSRPQLLVLCLVFVNGLAKAQEPAQEVRATVAEQRRVDLYEDPLPKGATMRLGTIRYRTLETVLGIAFADDRQSLLSVGSKRAGVWDVSTGKRTHVTQLTQVRTTPSTLVEPQVAVFSGNGKIVATASGRFNQVTRKLDTTIQVRRTSDWNEVRAFGGDIDASRSTFTFALDYLGETLVALDRGGKAHFWEVSTGLELLTHQFSNRGARWLSLSPDGKTVAVAGQQDELYVWDWQSGQDPRPIATPDVRAVGLTFSPDGTTLAVGANYGSKSFVLDIASGQRVRTFSAGNYVRALAFSPDGRLLALGAHDNRTVSIWDFATGNRIHRFDCGTESPDCLAFSHDGEKLAAVNTFHSSRLRIWDVAKGKLIGDDFVGHDSPPEYITFIDNSHIASAGDDGTVRIWDAASGRQLSVGCHRTEEDESQRTGWVRALSASADGKFLISSGLDDTVRLWNAKTGEQVYRLAGHGRLGGRRALAFHPDGSRFYSFGDDMNLRSWDVRTGKALFEHRIQPSGIPQSATAENRFDPFGDHGIWLGIYFTNFTRDATTLVMVVGQDAYFFDVASGKELRKILLSTRSGYALAISPDARHIVIRTHQRKPDSTGVAYAMELRDLTEGKLVRQIDFQDRPSQAAAFSPDGRLWAAAIGGEEEELVVWRTDSSEEVMRAKRLKDLAHSLAFSADSRQLLTGMADSSILLWDIPSLTDGTKK